MEEDDQDVYVAQLREVFESCDVEGNGLLNKQGLIELCQKLQLEDQIPKLIAQLLGNQEDGEVNFEDFKEGFVIVLSDAIDGLTLSSGEEPMQDVEEPPKMIVNEKRYGRRSRPFDGRFSDNDVSADEGDVESTSGSRPGSPDVKPSLEKQRKVQTGDEEKHKMNSKERRVSRGNSQKLRKRESLRKRDSLRRQESLRKRSSVHTNKEEILEASGQISNNKWSPHQSLDNPGVTSPTEEQQLKQIWSEVNVGANGFLDKNELSVVCEHIGMEGMDEDELSLLFDELDDDHDGQVSFEEFLHGLFMARDKSQESDPPLYSEGLFNGLESPRDARPASRTPAEQPMTSTMSRTVRTIEGNLIQMLDPGNTGLAKVEDIKDLWQAQENSAALELLKHAEVDSEGKVSLSQLTAVLESVIYEKSDAVCQAVVSIFKHELTYMRNQVESCNVEKEKLLENANNVMNEKSALIRESEESTRQLEHQHEIKLKKHEEAFTAKLQQAQQRAAADLEKATTTFSKKVLELEREIERYKAEECRAKQEIGEREDEIGRLDSTLNETQETLEESERVRARLEKELGNAAGLSKKLAEVVSERDVLKQRQSQHTDKGLRELEKLNRQLNDENDELKSEVELLKSQAKTNVKRNRSHRRRTTDRISRVGSVLSDYTKPVIIKRSKDDISSSDDSGGHDIIDGKPAIARVSGDGGSNEDEQNTAAINNEQKKTIEDLTSKLNENEVKMKELLNTIRLQEQNIKAKDGSINKQKTSLEKLKNEMKEKIADLTEKSEVTEKLQSDLRTREEQQVQNESELQQLKETQKKSDSTIRDYEATVRNLKSEIESLQRVGNSENSELKERFNKELANLTSQFTAEMEELQQRFSVEKDELEVGFQKKYKSLEKEYEGTLETITELKNSFKEEKQSMMNEIKLQKVGIEDEFRKEKEMLEQFHQEELKECKEKHLVELKSSENVINDLRNEKKQLEGFFEKEKIEIGEQFAVEKAEIEQEKTEIEKRLLAELECERQRYLGEKTNSASDYDKLREALEEKFLHDKSNLETNFAREKQKLQQTVEELRQVFANGESGLKGKLKDDFLRLVSEHKSLLDGQNGAQQDEIKRLKERTRNCTEEIEELKMTIERLNEQHEDEVNQIETRYSRERDILKSEVTERNDEIETLQNKITSLNNENSQLKEMKSTDRDDITDLEKTKHELEELHVEMELVRSESSRKYDELENSLQRLRLEKDKTIKNEIEKSSSFQHRIQKLEAENGQLKRLGNESRMRNDLERKIQDLECENRDLVRARNKTEGDLRRDIERLKLELNEVQDLLNRRNEKVLLSEKARKDLHSLERTVDEMEKERKSLENSLYQQNVKNTSLQDEITDLKRRNINVENRYKSELEAEKEKVNLIRAESSTAKSKYTRDVTELRERLDRALSNNERDQNARDKILNDAKTEIITLSKKLEEKAKRCRDLDDAKSAWEERVRMLDRQKREMELRVKKTQENVDDHVKHISRQLEESRARSIRTDTLVQELYIENAQLTKSLGETEASQKKAEKSNRQLLEQKRALQRVISKLCGANALA